MGCLYLTESDVAQLLKMSTVIEVIERAFRALDEGQAHNVPRVRARGGDPMAFGVESAPGRWRCDSRRFGEQRPALRSSPFSGSRPPEPPRYADDGQRGCKSWPAEPRRGDPGMAAGPLSRLRRMCLALPEAHEVEAWGAPTFRVRNKQFAMYAAPEDHHGGGRPAVWVKAVPGEQSRFTVNSVLAPATGSPAMSFTIFTSRN